MGNKHSSSISPNNIYIDNKYGHVQGSSNESKIHIFSIIFDQLNKYIN